MAFGRADIRKILTEAGATEENVEAATSKLVALHLGVVDALKNDNDTLTSRVNAAEKLKTQLDNATRELAELKEADYKTKYEAEKAASEKVTKEFETFKTEQAKKEARAAKTTAFTGILKDAGIPERHYATILKYRDVDALELDEKGNVKNAGDIRKEIIADFEPYIERTTEKGANTATPPTNNGGNTTMTKEEIMSIKNTAERQAAIAANHELFGI